MAGVSVRSRGCEGTKFVEEKWNEAFFSQKTKKEIVRREARDEGVSIFSPFIFSPFSSSKNAINMALELLKENKVSARFSFSPPPLSLSLSLFLSL